MKAYVRTSASTQEVELQELAIPKITEAEVLVEIQAFGVGMHDRYVVPPNATFPYVIGSEAAGVIIKMGSEVSGFGLGDRVILSSSFQLKGGCWAQYAAVSCEMLVAMPHSISFIQGAAIPVAGKTALESLRTLDLKPGNTLFVAGASGAIGTIVIQLAKNRGIRVIGSASSKNHPHLLLLGAEKAVDYSIAEWKDQIKQWMPEGVDAALAIHRGTSKDSMDIVKTGGKVVTVSGDKVDSERETKVEQMQHQLSIQEAVNMLIQDMVEKKLHLVIENVYSFEQALDALEKTETGHARGKLVVSMEEA
ncbi:NADP-dependent oxidoreductase [Planococcus faecalis]|nr:NADP-dependent oxidoreductase [Planococcus faecalis]